MLAFDDRVESLIEFDCADDSEVRLRATLASLAAEQDADLSFELLRGMARVQSLQRHFGDAYASLNAAESILERCAPPSKAMLLFERALVFEDQGEVDRAVECLEMAINHCKSHLACERIEHDATRRLSALLADEA